MSGGTYFLTKTKEKIILLEKMKGGGEGNYI